MKRVAEALKPFGFSLHYREWCERLESDAVVISETQDGFMRLYAERLRPHRGAVCCKLKAIRTTPPKSSGEAVILQLSHNGQRWAGNLDTCCMLDRYPADMEAWNVKLRGMVFRPGEFPS